MFTVQHLLENLLLYNSHSTAVTVGTVVTAVTVGRSWIFGDLSSGMGGALLQVMLDQVSRFVRSFILPSLTFLLALPFPLLPSPSPPLSLPLCLTGRP